MKPVESTTLFLLGISSFVALSAAPRAPVHTPSSSPVLALHAALANERHAVALYTASARKHPRTLLFALVRDAEKVHVARVLDLFARYDLEVPPDAEDAGKIPVPDRVAAACAVAVENERETIALFDGLVGDVNQTDVRGTFRELRDASRDRNLPAFERCAARATLPDAPRRGR